MSEEIFKEEKIITQYDVENEILRKEESDKLRKEENEKVRKEENGKLRKENEQLRKRKWAIKKNIVKDSEIKESKEKPKEIKSPEEDKNTTDSYPNWFDKKKFKNILAIIDSNKCNYRHEIGELKYTGIKDLLNNIKNNMQLVKYLLKKI